MHKSLARASYLPPCLYILLRSVESSLSLLTVFDGYNGYIMSRTMIFAA